MNGIKCTLILKKRAVTERERMETSSVVSGNKCICVHLTFELKNIIGAPANLVVSLSQALVTVL